MQEEKLFAWTTFVLAVLALGAVWVSWNATSTAPAVSSMPSSDDSAMESVEAKSDATQTVQILEPAQVEQEVEVK